MRCLVVDDESLARERLARLLAELPGCELCGEAGSGAEALRQAERLQPDLVLLDIRMPGMDGLEAARYLAGFDRPPAVVFTTAYGDHALEAFDAHAIDYLLKPIHPERLRQAAYFFTNPTANSSRAAPTVAVRRWLKKPPVSTPTISFIDPPITAPTIPTRVLPTSPNPWLFSSRLASHPASAPTIKNEIIPILKPFAVTLLS